MVFKAKVKCPLCGSAALLSKSNLSLFNGTFTLKDNPLYHCIGCGEEFASGKMVDDSLKSARRQFSFKRQLISTGGSLALTFPGDLLQYYGLSSGSKVNYSPINGRASTNKRQEAWASSSVGSSIGVKSAPPLLGNSSPS